MATKEERRSVDAAGLEVRDGEGSNPSTMTGYAAVFNSKYEDPLFMEVIRPGAFTRALKENQDVRALVDHDPTLILGRTKSNTLRLMQDERGLFTEVQLPDTSYARDLRTKMQRRDVDGMSFGFQVQDERWGTKDGKLYREILDVNLFDVSVVTYPAYPATTAQLRSAQEVLEAGRAFVREHPDAEVLAGLEQLENYLAVITRL